MSAPQDDELDLRLLRFRKTPSATEGGALADDLIAASRERDAVSVYELLRRVAPHDASLPFRAGRVLLGLGDLPAAQGMLLEALRIAPEDAAIAAALGEVLLKRGEPARARELLERHRGDAAVDKLYARAERLARLSAADIEEAPVPAEVRGESAPSDERVTRPGGAPDERVTSPGDAPLGSPSVPIVGASPRELEPTGPTDEDAAGFFEDVPTAMIDRAHLDALRAARASVEAEPEEAVSEGVEPIAESRPSEDDTRPIAIPLPEPEARAWSGPTTDEGDPADESFTESQPVEDAEHLDAPPRRRRVGVWIALAVFALAGMLAAGIHLGGDVLFEGGAERARDLRAEAERIVLEGEPAELERAIANLDEAARLAPPEGRDAELEAFARALALLELESGEVTRVRAAAEQIEGPLREMALSVADFVTTREAPALASLPLPSKALDPRAAFLLGRLRQASGGDPLVDFELAGEGERLSVPASHTERALVLLSRGERAEAAEALEDAPQGARVAISKILTHGGKLDPEDLAAASPAPFDRLLGALARATLHAESGRLESARAELSSLEPSYSRGPLGPLLAARVAYAVGDLALARRLANRAADRSHTVHARSLSTALALELGEIERAREGLAELEGEVALSLALSLAARTGTPDDAARAREILADAEIDPSLADAHRLSLALLEGAPEATLERLAAALEGAEAPEALVARSEHALRRGEPRVALELAARAAEGLPESAVAARVVGLAALELGDVERARTALERAVRASDRVARPHLARLLMEEGRAEEAASLLQEEAIESLPEADRGPARLLRAEALAAVGDLDGARAALERAGVAEEGAGLELSVDIALAAGEPARVIELLSPRLDPLIKKRKAEAEDAPLLVAYASALEANGELELAGSAFQLAVRSEPTSIEARLGYARALIRGRKEAHALRVLGRADDVLAERGEPDARPTELLLLRGRALLEQGKRAEATRSLLEAAERDDAPPEVLFYVGEALAGRKSAESRAAYERYLELEPEGPHVKRAARAIQR